MAYAGASVLALLVAFVSNASPSPDDPRGVWVVFVLGAIAFAAAAVRPAAVIGGWAWTTAGGLALLGLIAGLFAARTTICCRFLVSVHYGLPYPWADKHAEYRSLGGDGPPETFDEDAMWSVDWFNLLLDVAFWMCLAIVVVTLGRLAVGLVRRARIRSASA